MGAAGEEQVSSVASHTAGVAGHTRTALLFPTREITTTSWFSPALCHLEKEAALAKFLLLSPVQPHSYFFVCSNRALEYLLRKAGLLQSLSCS